MTVIYHIARASDWPPDTGVYRDDTLTSEDFIHCSTAAQFIPVANRLFRGRDDVCVLVIDETRVKSKIVYENLEGGQELFPHLYGPLETDAVIDTFALAPEPDGTFAVPPTLYRR